jgi:predicted PolB exonuclease-like 3'-5' exonuclease
MSILVFDMETRVDKALLRSVQYRGQELSEDEAYERMRDEIGWATGGDFFPLTFQVPVSIALAHAGDDHVLTGVEVLGADALGEAGLVRAFWARLEAFDGTLVSFNGRGFDLPVLELQALRHGCSAPQYFGDRNGLRARHGRHCDLYDWLTNGGAMRLRGGLDLVAKLVGLPGKGVVSGADVQVLWERAAWDQIHRYCRDDVLQTYFLFLRIEHLRGRLGAEQLAQIEAATSEYRALLGTREEHEAR